MGFLEIISIVIFPISLGSLQLAVERGWGSGLDLGHSNVLTRAKDISLGHPIGKGIRNHKRGICQ
jgi:hypothetical protein